MNVYEVFYIYSTPSGRLTQSYQVLGALNASDAIERVKSEFLFYRPRTLEITYIKAERRAA